MAGLGTTPTDNKHAYTGTTENSTHAATGYGDDEQ
jgi:hypothetical protein